LWRTVQTAQRDAGRRLRSALLDASDADGRATAMNRLAVAEARQQALEDLILTDDPAARASLGVTPPATAALLDLARRHPDTLYLSASPAREETVLLAIANDTTHGGPRAYALRVPVGAAAVARRVQAWRTAVMDSQDLRAARAESQAARELWDALVGPVDGAGLLRGRRRVVFVVEGALRTAPLAALIDPAGRRLVQRYAVSSALSLATLLTPARPQSLSVPPSRISLLCAADPMGVAPSRAVVAQRARESPPRRSTSALVAPFTSPRLAYARAEALRIASLFPGSLPLFGPSASETRVRSQIEDAAILHFATHGVLDPENGLRSWLLMAGEPKGSRFDGRLEAREVVGLRLQARLAVLSACETGTPARTAALAPFGFAWAFRAAGCPSVVASQWEVDDAATSRLMEVFYERLKDGGAKDLALQQAMCVLLNDRRTHRPFFWAAWQLVGDTGPLAEAALSRGSASEGRLRRGSRP
jgi:CHAT domain-containing protein